MIKPNMIRIIPAAIAIIAFIMGDPGALIHRARFGFRNAPMPNKKAIAPEIRSMRFMISIVSTLVLLLFHMPVFLLRHP